LPIRQWLDTIYPNFGNLYGPALEAAGYDELLLIDGDDEEFNEMMKTLRESTGNKSAHFRKIEKAARKALGLPPGLSQPHAAPEAAPNQPHPATFTTSQPVSSATVPEAAASQPLPAAAPEARDLALAPPDAFTPMAIASKTTSSELESAAPSHADTAEAEAAEAAGMEEVEEAREEEAADEEMEAESMNAVSTTSTNLGYLRAEAEASEAKAAALSSEAEAAEEKAAALATEAEQAEKEAVGLARKATPPVLRLTVVGEMDKTTKDTEVPAKTPALAALPERQPPMAIASESTSDKADLIQCGREAIAKSSSAGSAPLSSGEEPAAAQAPPPACAPAAASASAPAPATAVRPASGHDVLVGAGLDSDDDELPLNGSRKLPRTCSSPPAQKDLENADTAVADAVKAVEGEEESEAADAEMEAESEAELTSQQMIPTTSSEAKAAALSSEAEAAEAKAAALATAAKQAAKEAEEAKARASALEATKAEAARAARAQAEAADGEVEAGERAVNLILGLTDPGQAGTATDAPPTIALPAAQPIPISPAEGPPAAVGDRMELTYFDEGLFDRCRPDRQMEEERDRWGPDRWDEVKIVALEKEGDADAVAGKPTGPRALVTYTAYPGEDQKWVSFNRLRPAHPATPTAWTRRLIKGDQVELFYEGGWWEVQYLCRTKKKQSLVLAVRYGITHEVNALQLRPGWQRRASDGEWTLMLGGVARTVAEVESMLHSKASSNTSSNGEMRLPASTPATDGTAAVAAAAATAALSTPDLEQCIICDPEDAGRLGYTTCCSNLICFKCFRKPGMAGFEEAVASDDDSQDVHQPSRCPYCREPFKSLSPSRALNSMRSTRRSQREDLMSKTPGEELLAGTISIFARDLWTKCKVVEFNPHLRVHRIEGRDLHRVASSNTFWVDLQRDPDNLLVSMRKLALEEAGLANAGQDPSSLPQGAQPYRWVTGTVCWAVGTSCMKEDRHTGIHENDLGGVDSSATANRDNDGGSRRSLRDRSGSGTALDESSKTAPRKRPAEASCSVDPGASTCPRKRWTFGSEKEGSDDDDDECPNRAALGANDNTGIRAPISSSNLPSRAPICEEGYCELECPYCHKHYNLAKRIPMQLRPCEHQICNLCLPKYTQKGTCPMCETVLDDSQPSCEDGVLVAELRRLNERTSMLTATASTVLQLAAAKAQRAALSAAPPAATSADQPAGGGYSCSQPAGGGPAATLTLASAGVQEHRQRDDAMLRWAKERGQAGVPWAQHWASPLGEPVSMATELARRDAKAEAEGTDDSFSGLRDEDEDDAGGGAAAEEEDDAMGD